MSGQYEVVRAIENGDTIGYQIRWSVPDHQGRYYWCGHYFAGPTASLAWCGHAVELHCARLNLKRHPLPPDFHPIEELKNSWWRKFLRIILRRIGDGR